MQQPVQNLRPQRGLTFVELVVATGILAITSLGLAVTLTATPRITRGAGEEMDARAAMRAMVAEISAAPFSTVARDYQNRGFDVLGLHAPEGDADDLPGLVRFEYGEDGDRNSYTVSVTVSWQGVQGRRTIGATHVLANVRGDADAPTPLEDIESSPGETTEPPSENQFEDPSYQ